MKKYPALTKSGKGASITDKKFTDFTVEEIRDLIKEYQWLDFKNYPVKTEEAVAFMGQFGELTRNDRREDAILKLDASKKDEGEVLLGEGFMPLHRDGALMGNNIELVGIFCQSIGKITGGRTFISDIESAMLKVPKEIADLIRKVGVEARPVDKYYTSSADVWHKIPGFHKVEGKEFLNIGFPYLPGEKASWLVRIPGISEEKSQEYFEVMRKIMMDEFYCYYHTWQQSGDLLLLDNQRTLHGREAFQGQRALANIQVLQKCA